MFWKRPNGHGAFTGLIAGTSAAAIHHGLTVPGEALPGIKEGWIAVVHHYPSEMAQNFWTAIFAWSVCFLVTILVSLATKPRVEAELRGLVYSLTESPKREHSNWYGSPVFLGVCVLFLTLILNIIFR